MSEQDLLDLEGQVAFVTGAGQGAGRAIALTLAQHNAGGIAVNDFVLERAEAVADEIRQLGVPAAAVQADVGDYQSVATAMDAAKAQLGPVTLLVNNAGNAGPNSQMGLSPLFWETEAEDWAPFFHTNLFGVMNCCHLAMQDMVDAGRGRIVTIISDSGRVGEARLAVYGAAKAGAAGLMRSLAKEGGRHGITANCISLSTLEPQMDPQQLEAFYANDRIKSQLSRYTLRRFGQASDVANMVLFLCSGAASWITGQTYPVNGGYTVSQ